MYCDMLVFVRGLFGPSYSPACVIIPDIPSLSEFLFVPTVYYVRYFKRVACTLSKYLNATCWKHLPSYHACFCACQTCLVCSWVSHSLYIGPKWLTQNLDFKDRCQDNTLTHIPKFQVKIHLSKKKNSFTRQFPVGNLKCPKTLALALSLCSPLTSTTNPPDDKERSPNMVAAVLVTITVSYSHCL